MNKIWLRGRLRGVQCPEVINKVLNPEAIPAKKYYICNREGV